MIKKLISKKVFVVYFIFIALTWLEAVVNPWLVSRIVELFQQRQLHLLWQALVFGVIGNLLILIGLTGKRYYFAKLIAEFSYHLKQKITQHFLYGQQIEDEAFLADIEKDVPQLEETYVEPLVIVMASLGFTSISIIYALVTNFYLGLVFVFFYAIPAIFARFGGKQLDDLSQAKMQANQRYLQSLTDVLKGIRVIRNYGVQTFFETRLTAKLSTSTEENLKFEKKRSLNSFIINGLDTFCSLIPIIIGGVMCYYQQLSPAQFVAIYLVSYNIGYQFQELAYFLNTIQGSKGLREKYAPILEEVSPSEKKDVDTLFPITFEDVSFSYEQKPILKHFSCEIRQGEKVVIIGESGVGKTTLLDLLFGDLKPTSGKILFAGQELSPAQRKQLIGYVLQDNYCFSELTMAENIALSTDFKVESVHQLLQKVQLNKELDQLPTLSGGERQRMEIARMLYHEKNLILADEVKANLDAQTMAKIDELLFALPQTIIEVRHHYSKTDLERYDQVIQLS